MTAAVDPRVDCQARTRCVGNRVGLVEVRMKFSGRLQIEADPRDWLKTELDLSQGRVELVHVARVRGSQTCAAHTELAHAA